jgi:uncharacterized membrane protein (DUF373 family)
MLKTMDWFERMVIYILIVLMMLVILTAIIVMIVVQVREIIRDPAGLLNIEHLLVFFGYVLLILIGVELLDTIRAYLVEHVVHAEVVLEVALIAVARKIIILEFKDVSSLTLFGIAALVASLALAYYLEKRGRSMLIAKTEKTP